MYYILVWFCHIFMVTYEGGYSGTEGYTGVSSYSAPDSSQGAPYSKTEGGVGYAPIYKGGGGGKKRKKTIEASPTPQATPTKPKYEYGVKPRPTSYFERPASGVVRPYSPPGWIERTRYGVFISPERASIESEKAELRSQKSKGYEASYYRTKAFGYGVVGGAAQLVRHPVESTKGMLGFGYSMIVRPRETMYGVKQQLLVAPSRTSGEITGQTLIIGGAGLGLKYLKVGKPTRIGITETSMVKTVEGSPTKGFEGKVRVASESSTLQGKKYVEYVGERKGFQVKNEDLIVQKSEVKSLKPVSESKFLIRKQGYGTIVSKAKPINIKSITGIREKGFTQFSQTKIVGGKSEQLLTIGEFGKGEVSTVSFRLKKGRIVGKPIVGGYKTSEPVVLSRAKPEYVYEGDSFVRQPDVYEFRKTIGMEKIVREPRVMPELVRAKGIIKSKSKNVIVTGEKMFKSKKGELLPGKNIFKEEGTQVLIEKNIGKYKGEVVPDFISIPKERIGLKMPKASFLLSLSSLKGIQSVPISKPVSLQTPIQKPIPAQKPVIEPITKPMQDIKLEPKSITEPKLGGGFGGNISNVVPPPPPPFVPVSLKFGGGTSVGKPIKARKVKGKAKYTRTIEGITFGGKRLKGTYFSGLELRA